MTGDDLSGLICMLTCVLCAAAVGGALHYDAKVAVKQISELEHDWYVITRGDGRQERFHWEGPRVRSCPFLENGQRVRRNTTCATILDEAGEIQYGWRDGDLAMQIEAFRERQARLRQAGPIPRLPGEPQEVSDVLVEMDRLKEALTPPKKPAP